MDNQKREIIVDNINKIIQTNIDRAVGYERAIEHVNDEHLKSFFQDCCNISAEYAIQLKPFVLENGGTPVKNTSTVGDMYRAWMDIRKELTNNNDLATLRSCAKGEDIALDAYKEIVKKIDNLLEPNLIETLNKQQLKINNMLLQIKDFLLEKK